MPLVAHNDLPTFDRLRAEGIRVLPSSRALHQHIRELHIGLLNMMPDAALSATERQFFRLVGESNPIAQFYVHPFTLPELKRSTEAQDYIERYYEPAEFLELKRIGLEELGFKWVESGPLVRSSYRAAEQVRELSKLDYIHLREA